MPPRRVLLDECIDRRFRSHIKEHDVRTVPEMRWAGSRNGDLLKMAAEEFDVFVTVDQNLYFQQNLRDLPIAVVVLRAASNRLPDLLPNVPTLQAALADLRLRQVTFV